MILIPLSVTIWAGYNSSLLTDSSPQKKKNMLLGKRPRPPIKRTTSMTEFTLDLSIGDAPPQPPAAGFDQRYLGSATAVSPRNHRRNLADFVETPHFLRSCFLCKRRLVPGRDIFMYKGDSAFCSLECRHQQMNQDWVSVEPSKAYFNILRASQLLCLFIFVGSEEEAKWR
ncbi:hypothetical protein TEA_026376 [Camellia sinensis var. sinensis]|uniref:FLZ-type domain-containing protein n=1 Tax=Camellia sinensis var. sinensis TaxID=542762 RepID=A0A4S4D2A2_CAMSN|nr:hypothetical protein TEA_026376 [Camellia sinensis var. sinensis]